MRELQEDQAPARRTTIELVTEYRDAAGRTLMRPAAASFEVASEALLQRILELEADREFLELLEHVDRIELTYTDGRPTLTWRRHQLDATTPELTLRQFLERHLAPAAGGAR